MRVPLLGFVSDLRGYDPLLRCRWGASSGRWYLERKMPERSRQWLLEQPAEFQKTPSGRDRRIGWQEGYCHVVAVPPELLHWSIIGEELRRIDAEVQGGFARLAEMLDEEDARREAETDRANATVIEAVTKDAAEEWQWRAKRRIAAGVDLEDLEETSDA